MDFSLMNVLTLLRQISFMVLLYLGLGLLVERHSRNPDSKVKAFFRVLAMPVTAPVARFMRSGTEYGRVLAVSFGVVAGLWILIKVAIWKLPPG